MQGKLFKGLKSANVTDDQAVDIINELEDYIAVKITEANKGLEAKLDVQNLRIDNLSKGLEAQLKAQTWLIGSLGFILTVGVLLSALSPIIVKMIH